MKSKTIYKLTKSEAEEEFKWLKRCKFEGGSFYRYTNRFGKYVLQYERGKWISGEWKSGDLINCNFMSGKVTGRICNFKKGEWHSGIFEGFKVYNSIWEDGIFRHGYFTKSKFLNGKFEYGVFEDSIWYKGEWGEKSHAKIKGFKYDKIPAKNKFKEKKKRGPNQISKNN